MPHNAQPIEGWIGRDLVDASGDKIGRIEDIYVDDQTGEPEWVAVSSGMLRAKGTFVPLTGAAAYGDDLQVQYTKAQVNDAPVATSGEHLSPEEEARLYAHYGRDHRDQGVATETGQATGRDDAMTRSEEELEVGTTSREAGRVRLRKWVDVERVETTVPVAREEVRIEREPITEGNVDRAMSGPEISESEHEVVLHEEEAVANTRVQPKERIRLEKDVVADEELVEADLRKERIEIEGDTPRR